MNSLSLTGQVAVENKLSYFSACLKISGNVFMSKNVKYILISQEVVPYFFRQFKDIFK